MRKISISSENAEFQIIESLKNNRAKRAYHNEIFIEGIESIKQAIKSGTEITRIVTTGKISSWAENITAEFGNRANGGAAKIIEMTDDLFRKLCDRSDPSEMLVTAKMPAPNSNRALPEKPFILVLDRPSDTGNLGSIIRCANSFGVDSVLLIGHGVDPWDPKTIRASLGSVFFTIPLLLESFDELEKYAGHLKTKCDLKIWGTDSQGSSPLASVSLKRPLMLILGNEARGMSVALKSLCDGIVNIPVSGNVNSLNVACAAGIFMWEVLRNQFQN